MKKSPIIGKDVSCVKSWSKRELALAVLVIFAAPAVPYVTFRLLGDLLALSLRSLPIIGTIPSLLLYACISALVTGVPFFLWVRRGRRVWPWILVLAVCLGLLLLSALNSNTTFHLVAVVTGYHNSEYIGFLLLYLIICYQGMLLGVALAAAAAWVLRKISGRKRP